MGQEYERRRQDAEAAIQAFLLRAGVEIESIRRAREAERRELEAERAAEQQDREAERTRHEEEEAKWRRDRRQKDSDLANAGQVINRLMRENGELRAQQAQTQERYEIVCEEKADVVKAKQEAQAEAIMWKYLATRRKQIGDATANSLYEKLMLAQIEVEQLREERS